MSDLWRAFEHMVEESRVADVARAVPVLFRDHEDRLKKLEDEIRGKGPITQEDVDARNLKLNRHVKKAIRAERERACRIVRGMTAIPSSTEQICCRIMEMDRPTKSHE